jgi:hypothetical protein
MKRYYKYLLFIFTLPLFISCNTGLVPFYFENRKLTYIPVDILEPAELTFPLHIQELLLLEPDTTYENIRARILYRDTSDTINGNINREITENVYFSLSNVLWSSPRFGIQKNETISISPDEISWERYDSILQSADADAILLLDVFDAAYTFYTTDKYSYEYNAYLFQGYVKTQVKSVWSIRDPASRERYVIRVNHTDQYEGALEPTQREALESLPSLREIISYEATVVGEKCAKDIGPYWITVQRGIYGISHSQLRKARKQIVNENDWDAAKEIWESYVDDSNIILAKHSQFNLVVATEVLGNINDAIELAEKYLLKYDDPHMEEYMEILKDRQQKKQLLDEQFHVTG